VLVPLPGIFPEIAPVVRVIDGERRLSLLRWSIPTLPKFLAVGAIDRGVTNIRNTQSAHWRP